jgi:hypothetical protein
MVLASRLVILHLSMATMGEATMLAISCRSHRGAAPRRRQDSTLLKPPVSCPVVLTKYPVMIITLRIGVRGASVLNGHAGHGRRHAGTMHFRGRALGGGNAALAIERLMNVHN